MSPVIKRKGEKFTLPSKYLLFILTILCTGMMVLTLSTNIFNRPLNTIVGYVIVPFQKGISTVGGWLSDRSKELVQIRELLNENEELKKQVDELTVENTKLQQDKYALNNLRELYKIDSQYEQYEKIGAQIIGSDTINWYHSFVIDKGSDDGIEVDMTVMAGGGLVGRIASVAPNWSRVISIISDNSNVSGSVLATGDNLMVSGDLKLVKQGNIRYGQLADEEGNVQIGDKVVTSNISDKYLPDILIGYIGTIHMDSNNLTKSGYITPAVDFEHLEEVLIILEKKQSYDEELQDE